HALDDASHDVALAADSASDRRLAGADATRAAVPALVLVPVLGLAADERLIDLDNAHELLELNVLKPGTDAMAHGPSCPIGPDAILALDLQGGNALLGCHHAVNDLKPRSQGDIRVLEDRSDKHREAIAVFGARLALPVKGLLLERVDVGVAATRAARPFRP